ncbi:unnamed protein product [Cunninghamella blakesleeana]
MILICKLFVFFFIIYIRNSYCQITTTIDKSIADIINPLVNGLPNQTYVGVAVGIVKEDQKYFYSFGSININKKEKPKEDTIFEIGSITKTFTSLLLADAYINNILDLNDHLKSCNGSNTTNGFCFKGTPISLTNLSTHTSSYPAVPTNLPLTSLTPYDNYNQNDLNLFLSNYSLLREPGSLYEYSNLGYGILGNYISDKHNDSFASLIEKKISNPYSLYDTKISLNNEQLSRLATGYLSGNETPYWNMTKSSLMACGALHSTMNDMLKYLKLQMYSENEIFKMTHMEKYKLNSNSSIGLAWVIDKLDNIIWHNGATYGFRSFIAFDKKSSVGTVVMANSLIQNDTRVEEAGIKIINLFRK